MAESGADFERHGLFGITLPELYVRVRPPGQVEAVFGVQRHDTNGHVAEIDQLSHLTTSIEACVRCVMELLAVRRLRDC